MSKKKPGKFNRMEPYENPFRDKALVKFEGALTDGQLTEIANGLEKLIILYTNVRQELMSEQGLDKY